MYLRPVISAILAGGLGSVPASACTFDGASAGRLLGAAYCATVIDAYRSGNLALRRVRQGPLCDGESLACKTAVADAVAADHTCSRLYHLDFDGGGLREEGYSARSLYDLYSQICSAAFRPPVE